jgi:hypothetical protein
MLDWRDDDVDDVLRGVQSSFLLLVFYVATIQD